MRIAIPLAAMLLYSTVVFSQAPYSPETLQKIKEVENNITGNIIFNKEKPGTIASQMKKYKVKGMSIAVIEHYKIAWAKGYGWADEAEKRPVTTETLFEPGSISKSLNAVGILKLAQDKKVDLYTDVNTYLKSWKFPYDSVSKGKKITLAQILSHSAGLTVHGFPGHNIHGPIPTVIEVLDGKAPAVTAPVRSMFEPGLKSEYSGGGTTISQLLLTDITGQAYEVWMYENVLKPIGMMHSSYLQPPAKERQALCASAYRRDGTPVDDKFHVYPEQAAAGLWMTPSDLCNYIIDMQLAYKGGASKVLNADMVKLHLTPYNDQSAAMGTFIENHDGALYFQHGAGNDGFCGQFFGSLEDGYGVAIFLNTEDGKLLYDVVNSVAKAYNWKNFYHEPKRRKQITVAENILKTYEGIYLFDTGWAGISKEEYTYYFSVDHINAQMHFETPVKFFNEEFRAEKEFTKDANGNITGYTRMVEGKPYPNAVKVMNPDTLKLQMDQFTQIGWYLFEFKKYKESLVYFKRGAQLYPQDLNMKINMAHLYLFNNDYASAIAIYKAHLNETVRPGFSWQDLMREDYTYFKDKKYDTRLFDKVFEELKVKKTAG